MPTPSTETEKSPPRETAVKIMDAAEQLFASHGYEGTSIRQITDLAGVRLALAHYHFDSKEHMFCEVLTRRASVVNESRYQLLAHYRLARGSAALTVEEIARSYISPYLYWSMHGGDGWQNYAKLAARIISTERWIELLSALFNPLAQAFLQELRRTFPGREEHRIQWAFDFMVGAMSNTFSENNRIVALSNGLCSSENREDACSHLLPFVVAGVTTTVDAAPASFSHDFATILQASQQNA